jgi:hypothetical protein
MVRAPLTVAPVAGPGQVPAQHEVDQRERGDPDAAGQRRDHDDRDGQEGHLQDRDEDRRHRFGDRLGDRADVAGAAGAQVAGRHPFGDRGRQGEGAFDEGFPDARGRPLAEAVPGQQGVTGQQDLGGGAGEDGDGVAVDRGVAVADAVDDAAQQPGRGQAGQGGEHVERDHGADGAAVGGEQADGGPADLGAAGDGECGHWRETSAR